MTTQFFAKRDSPHGLAKKIIIYRFLQGELGRAVRTQRSGEEKNYHLTYFDAFSGAGRYGSPKTNKQEEIQETGESEREEPISNCPFDESFGSPLVALEAIYKHASEQEIDGAKKILLVFVEKDRSIFENLKKNICQYLDSKKNYSRYAIIEDQIKVNISTVVKDHHNNVSLDIKLHCCDFREYNNDDIRNNWPMVSFFDPFGCSQIPMKYLIEYVGNRKSIIINLMVSAIDRFIAQKKNEKNLNELFGCSQDDYIDDLPENFETLDVPHKMRMYSQIYRKNFQNKKSVRFLEFSMRKGSNMGVEQRYMYYILCGALDLTSMAIGKYAMHVTAQNFRLETTVETTSNELFFSDFHFNCGISWRPETSEETEGDFIYNHWEGKTVSFGELKEWIILKSPYQVHSKALKYLEKSKRLKVLSTEYERESEEVPKYKRKMNSFPPNVGINADDKDWDKREEIKYCNGWMINFPNAESNNA